MLFRSRARFRTPVPDPRVVIVDIDEASLARMSPEFGRWPWPRDTLATVLAHIERQKKENRDELRSLNAARQLARSTLLSYSRV